MDSEEFIWHIKNKQHLCYSARGGGKLKEHIRCSLCQQLCQCWDEGVGQNSPMLGLGSHWVTEHYQLCWKTQPRMSCTWEGPARAAGQPRQEKGSITQCLKPVPKRLMKRFGISFQFSSVLLSHIESSPFTVWDILVLLLLNPQLSECKAPPPFFGVLTPGCPQLQFGALIDSGCNHKLKAITFFLPKIPTIAGTACQVLQPGKTL